MWEAWVTEIMWWLEYQNERLIYLVQSGQISLSTIAVAVGLLVIVAWVMAPKRKSYRRKGKASVGSRKQRPFNEQRRAKFGRHKRWKDQAQYLLASLKRSPVSEARLIELLKGMDPYAFEYLITECFEQSGHEIRKLKRSSGDGGIDGMTMIDGRWHLIQAKRYGNTVPTAMVKDFANLCAAKHMPGLFITTSSFPRRTHDLLRQHRPSVKLMDSRHLLDLINRPA